MIETSKTRGAPDVTRQPRAAEPERGIATVRLTSSTALRVNLKILAAVVVSLLLWAAIAIIFFI